MRARWQSRLPYFFTYICLLCMIALTCFSDGEQLIYSSQFDNPSAWWVDGNNCVTWKDDGCPQLDTAQTCVNVGGTCLIASDYISTVGYHAIRIVIDIKERELNAGETCLVRYWTDGVFTYNNAIVVDRGDDVQYNLYANVPDDPSFIHQPQFRIGMTNTGDAMANDHCYFGNVRVYASVSATPSPTKTTTHPTMRPTKPPTSYPTIRPTKAPINNPTNAPTNYPTKIPTMRPTNNPTNNPTLTPTLHPTQNPTAIPTRRPTEPGTLTCGDRDSGYYNNEPITFTINVPLEADVKFDATQSNFEITSIEAFTTQDVLLGSDVNDDKIMWLLGQSPDDYIFRMDSDSATSGEFDVQITCFSANPTPSPTQNPTDHPTHNPTNHPSNTPTITSAGSSAPSDQPSTSTVHDPTHNPSFLPTTQTTDGSSGHTATEAESVDSENTIINGITLNMSFETLAVMFGILICCVCSILICMCFYTRKKNNYIVQEGKLSTKTEPNNSRIVPVSSPSNIEMENVTNKVHSDESMLHMGYTAEGEGHINQNVVHNDSNNKQGEAECTAQGDDGTPGHGDVAQETPQCNVLSDEFIVKGDDDW